MSLDTGQLHFTCPEAEQSRPYHHSVPRWHFWMVLDTDRNLAYDRAIRSAVDMLRHSGDDSINVLDVGAGCGLLSLSAARYTMFIYPLTTAACIGFARADLSSRWIYERFMPSYMFRQLHLSRELNEGHLSCHCRSTRYIISVLIH